MKRKDLIIGKTYIMRGNRTYTGILEGFDSDGDPMLRPVGESDMEMITQEDVLEDSLLIPGCYCHSLEVFLWCYEPYSK